MKWPVEVGHSSVVGPSGTVQAVSVWGAARPAGAGTRVAIQAGSGDSYTTVATARTGPRGYLRARLSEHSGRWRLAWTDDQGVDHFSRVAGVNSTPVRRR
jgi:hypothetical protein